MSQIVSNQSKSRATAAVTWHVMLVITCHAERSQLSVKFACATHLRHEVVIQYRPAPWCSIQKKGVHLCETKA